MGCVRGRMARDQDRVRDRSLRDFLAVFRWAGSLRGYGVAHQAGPAVPNCPTNTLQWQRKKNAQLRNAGHPLTSLLIVRYRQQSYKFPGLKIKLLERETLKETFEKPFDREISSLKRQAPSVLYFVLGHWCNKNKNQPLQIITRRKIAGLVKMLFPVNGQ